MTGRRIFLENDIPLPQRRFLSLTSLYEFHLLKNGVAKFIFLNRRKILSRKVVVIYLFNVDQTIIHLLHNG
jgi:hypothetical protein